MAAACACVLALPAWAVERMATVTLPAQPLSRALAELGRQARVDILAPAATVGDRRAPPLRSRLTPSEALERLLAGSGLEFEQSEPGVYIVRARRGVPAETPSGPVALPELLVLGMRTQNVDQRRDPDDIQPYRVFERSTLRAAQAHSAEDFLQIWLTSNANTDQSVPRLGRGRPPSRSIFAFRNPVALDRTLVLVDGRRMPAVPDSYQFIQADVGPIPLMAVERIETLGASGGAIYGLGAVNGVVNLVLDRDYRGADIAATAGAGQGGDGEYRRLDARIGYSSPSGATALMVRYGHKRFNGVSYGDRREAVEPLDGALMVQGEARTRASGAGVTLFGVGGPFAIGSGVNALSVSKTYIPEGYDGAGALEQILRGNAGQAAPGLAPAHRDRLLSSDSRSDAILANIRQRLWNGAEAYVDLVYLASQDQGPVAFGSFSTWLTPGQGVAAGLSGPNMVEVVAPHPFNFGWEADRLISRRVTAGLVFDLSARWRGGIDYAVGDTRSRRAGAATSIGALAGRIMQTGVSVDGRPVPNPFGDQAKFVADLRQYAGVLRPTATYYSSRLEDISLRASGPVARIGGRDATLSFTAQQMWEALPAFPSDPRNFVSIRSRSLYAELRAPLEGIVGLPGLEFQAAVRHQVGRIRLFYTNPVGPLEKSADLYLLGLKAEPVAGLVLRASYASGAQLPENSMFVTFKGTATSSLIDTKRSPTLRISSEGNFTRIWGGNPDLRPDQTRTFSAGAVLTTPLVPRTRVSVDYTRIEGHDLMVQVFRGVDYYILNEDLYPNNVIRAPLTDADRAKGYTAGRIVEIRDINENTGASLIQAVDLVAEHDLDLAGGRLALSAAASWQPSLVFRTPYVGTSKLVPDGGAPKWRGALGARWATSRFAASATLRYIAANRPTALPERTTVDLGIAWELPPRLGASETELRLGVRNLFDKWSVDDPLKRRLEASLTARF